MDKPLWILSGVLAFAILMTFMVLGIKEVIGVLALAISISFTIWVLGVILGLLLCVIREFVWK